jgi:hypothetical protein
MLTNSRRSDRLDALSRNQSLSIDHRNQTVIARLHLDPRSLSTVNVTASGSRTDGAERTDVVVETVSTFGVFAFVGVGTWVTSEIGAVAGESLRNTVIRLLTVLLLIRRLVSR